MKKPFLVGGLSFLTFALSLGAHAATLNLPMINWNLPGPQAAYFEFENGVLTLVPEVPAAYASILPIENPVAYTQDELASLQPTLETLLTTGLTINVEGQPYSFPAQMKDLPITKENGVVRLSFTEEFLDYVFSTIETAYNIPSTDITLLSADSTKPSKVEMEGVISDGRELIRPLTTNVITAAVNSGTTTVDALTRTVLGKIVNETGVDLGPLEYLAEGRSSFWGSSPEREFNIKKAINEKFNGILIPPGGEFSYVEFLGEIEYGGWKQAYTIFKGTQLEKAPAGGVCQISTTVYRAALATGLEITEQRSHSLYVIYYQHFGDGLDATVFPGEQDFKFKNNTDNYLLMVAQEEGYKEAVLRFYGEDDGRSTELWGPYTASTQDDESKAGVGASLGIGQIAWKYLIHHGDGSTETKWLLSDYMSPALQHRGETPSKL
jgi:vancomycin resistance protein YoaR